MLFTVKAITPADYDSVAADADATANATPAPHPERGPGAASRRRSAPSGRPTLGVTGRNIAFEPTSLTAPADQPFTITFTNNDAGIPHNVVIHRGRPPARALRRRDLRRRGRRLYPIPALQAGTYAFSCTVHPNMTGTLTVK